MQILEIRTKKQLIDVLERNKIDIYVNSKCKKETNAYDFLAKYFELEQPATYFTEIRKQQCGKSRRRSFIDLYWMTKKYFDITPEDLFNILDDLVKRHKVIANACGDVGGCVFRSTKEALGFNTWGNEYTYYDYRNNHNFSMKDIFKFKKKQ